VIPKSALPILLLMAVSTAAGQAESKPKQLMAEALKPSPLEQNLRRLTDEVGGRVPGTPAMEKAVAWAEKAMREAGGESVHSEEFTMPVSWREGATRVEITAPEKFQVHAVSIAWSPAIKGVLRARVVDVGEGDSAGFAGAGELAGVVVLVHSKVLETWEDLFAEYLRAPAIIDAAVKGKAAAIAFISTREGSLLYRHINNFKGEVDRLPMILVGRVDGERIAKLLAAGKKVEMAAKLPNKIGGPFRTSNVVGEIRGSEKPDEFVIVGAHLDSWELGTGALDDGCNAALVVDSLRTIHASGLRPRRSIRFVLFSGEEQGMLGSLAYVKKHREELDRTAAVLIFDEGSGPVTGFSLGGRKDIIPQMTSLAEPFKQWNATALTTDAFIGTDNFDFLLEGVPTLVANQEAANYLVNYHASSDTYDKVDFGNLKKHVAMAAALAFQIADAAEPLGPRQSREQVQQLLEDTGVRKQMETFDLWQQWESQARGRSR
jgi:carboxypeptidase Q